MSDEKEKKSQERRKDGFGPPLSNTSEITPAIPSATSYTHACYLLTGLTPQRKTCSILSSFLLRHFLKQGPVFGYSVIATHSQILSHCLKLFK